MAFMMFKHRFHVRWPLNEKPLMKKSGPDVDTFFPFLVFSKLISLMKIKKSLFFMGPRPSDRRKQKNKIIIYRNTVRKRSPRSDLG